MSQERAKPRIALIGVYPPPYGGISIHIQRLKERLEDLGYQCVGYDLKREGDSAPGNNIIRVRNIRRWTVKYFFRAKEDIIHSHTFDWRMRVIIGLMGLLGRKTVISIHSWRESLEKAHWVKRAIIAFTLRRTSAIITVNAEIRDLIISLGVKKERIEVIPAFLSPSIRQEEINEIPQEIWHFINRHHPVITANASNITFYNKQDLYGIDMCIDLCARLKDNYQQIGFLFCLPSIGDSDYLHKMEQRIKEKGIEDNFLFQTMPSQLYPVLMKSDLFVRPTNTDGYAVSAAEAIYFRVPAVASDVCYRPEGTILFRSRDIQDFASKVKDVLSNYDMHKQRLESMTVEDYAEKIIRIYEKLYAQ